MASAAAGFGGYGFASDQAELDTDILFKSRADLERIHADLVTAASIGFGATDGMRFLGRKSHHAFTGEIVIDSKKRPAGCRIEFRLRRNAIKLYAHRNVLCIDTTVNNRTSRLNAKLRGHRLIAKVKNSRLYRVTQHSVSAMWAAIRFRGIDFPTAFNMPTSFAQ